MKPKQTIDGRPSRYVHVPLVRCPACRATKHKTDRSELRDGVRHLWRKCQVCGWRFAIIREPEDESFFPES